MKLVRSLNLIVTRSENGIMLCVDNETTYPYSEKLKQLVKECKDEKEYEELVEKYGKDFVLSCIEKNILVNSEKKWILQGIEVVEIETSTHCNWHCKYCPESFDPKKVDSMPMELFEEIIDKAVRAGTVKYVTFNSYNEPTIDKLFMERVKYVQNTSLKIRLHTNGTGLNEEKMDYLKEAGCLEFICFNLPTLDKDEFINVTKYYDYEKIIRNIDYAVKINLPVIFSIQGTPEEIKKNIGAIRQRYQPYVEDKIEAWGTIDRAGLLENEYKQNIYLSGRLYSGCHAVNSWMFVNVKGDLFLCSEDYYQKTKYSNIKKGEIYDLINSDDAIELRKKVCGELDAPEDFICRKCITMLNNKMACRHL